MDTRTAKQINCQQLGPLLQQHPIFARLDSEQMGQVCRYARLLEFEEGEILFHQGDETHSFFYVCEGLIKLYRESISGQEKIVQFQPTGRVFAEALMFQEMTNYPVSAAAMKKSSAIAINSHEFLKLLQKSPDLCLVILGDLSRRLHELVAEVDHLSLMSGRNRVAAYFLDLYSSQGNQFSLEIPKNAIASLLSLQPETFSRLVKELRTKNILQIQDCDVTVQDADELKRFAGIS